MNAVVVRPLRRCVHCGAVMPEAMDTYIPPSDGIGGYSVRDSVRLGSPFFCSKDCADEHAKAAQDEGLQRLLLPATQVLVFVTRLGRYLASMERRN